MLKKQRFSFYVAAAAALCALLALVLFIVRWLYASFSWL